ncbi:hypothetical protein NIES970_04090 [[Synechococcus] sp. NIES-970]|uniref:DUF3370 domain-containing protein n=1 Tax=Picosynechococcus sp. NKBG15041c TaxID=1407650 RepID=UPI0003FCC89C|nr:DUF3370 domain-containing protein [Picosynechococcus sp. NKBG15041c]BAW95502.1 hypothetical protein NIES970_04090 [[Synechococcus] sp. NIES-970]
MFFLPFFVAQAQAPEPVEIVRPQEVRVLPGQLDSTPVFNSNSPEKVLGEGILLSTFPPAGKTNPEAHLDFAFSGRFDLFAHHVAEGSPEDLRDLHIGAIAYNPGDEPVTLYFHHGASYLSQPDAPFVTLEAQVPNPRGTVYAGPGSRVMDDLLRRRLQDIFPKQLTIAPQSYEMIFDLPIPVKELTPPLNGRSTYLELTSTGPLHIASLALFEKDDAEGNLRPPTFEEWQALVETGDLSTPRDRVPSVPGEPGALIYGRVAGVSEGGTWRTQIYDTPTWDLTIPASGETFSYGISTLVGGSHGTGQIQTAEMLRRYPDTAYAAHGNYGVFYDLTLPLHNPTEQNQTVTIALETPIKQEATNEALRFFDPLPTATFFRGPVRVNYRDDQGRLRTDYFHLVQRRGQMGDSLVTLEMPPGDRRLINVQLRYPPDATPPQVLTVKTQ